MKPSISIIIPAYNRADLLPETLDSVLAQSYAQWECVIVDDGSTDNTENIVDQYCKKDHRFRYYHRPGNFPKGGNGARNYGFLKSKGEYVLWLDSDDKLETHHLESIFSSVEAVENAEVVVTNYKFWSGDLLKNNSFSLATGTYNRDDFFSKLAEQNHYLLQHCYATRRDIVLRSGLWNEFLKVNQDGEFFFRILSNVSRITYLADTFALYRIGQSENLSNYANWKKMESRIQSWQLIEAYAQVSNSGSDFVGNAKKRLYRFLLKSSNAQLIRKYQYFFKPYYSPSDLINVYNKRILKKLKRR